MSKYDVAVIGAGVNGLTTAAYLAKSGKRVVVLERRSEIGGTAAITHDAGWLPPAIAADLELERHGLAARATEPRVIAASGDGGWLVLHPDVSATVESLRAHSAADAEKWPAFAARIALLAGFLQVLYDAAPPRPQPRSMPDLLSLMKVGRKLRGLGKVEMIELLRTLPMSVAELLDDWFELDALKGTLAASGVHGLCQGPLGGGTAFLFVHHQVGRPAGSFRGANSTHTLIAALAAAARSRGVEIITDAQIDRVRIDNGRANGVVLADGSEVDADIVVSSADPRHTFIGLVDPIFLDPDFVHSVRSIKYRGISARVNLVLSEAPRCEPLGDDAVISISPSISYLERAFDDAKYGRVSSRPYIEARVTRAGATFELAAHVQYAPYHLRDGTWDDARREALGTTVIDLLDEHLPNLKQSVISRQVLTPLDLEQTYGVTEGSLDHGELTLDQILFMRPVAGWSEYRTPIQSLYLCGAGTHPGGSIAGGAGRLAARAILER